MLEHPGSAWIKKNYDSLPTSEWVAVGEYGLVAHAPDYYALMNILWYRGVKTADVVIMFIPKNPGPTLSRQRQ